MGHCSAAFDTGEPCHQLTGHLRVKTKTSTRYRNTDFVTSPEDHPPVALLAGRGVRGQTSLFISPDPQCPAL